MSERSALALALAVMVAILVFLYSVDLSHGADADGRYTQSQHHDWVRSLHSPAGSWCCDISDGHALVDADWRSSGDRYQVKVSDDWVDVPKDAVIAEPNRLGQTIVWFINRDGKPVVTCFLPGALG
jgi:hypothetical protein